MLEQPESGTKRQGRGRPTREAAQAKIGTLLQVAAQLFEKHGFAGVTMAAVAQQADVSKTTLYAYFPTKEALFRAICSYACRVPADQIAAVTTEGRDPAQVLLDFARTIASANANEEAIRFLRLAIFEAPRFPELAAQILSESRKVTAPLGNYLTRLVQQGRLDVADPATLTEQFIAMVAGGPADLLDIYATSDRTEARIRSAVALLTPFIRAKRAAARLAG